MTTPPEEKTSITRVTVTTAGHTVEIHADLPLSEVAAKALELWEATRFDASKAQSAVGFSSERAGFSERDYEHQADMRNRPLAV